VEKLARRQMAESDSRRTEEKPLAPDEKMKRNLKEAREKGATPSQDEMTIH
jgi:hypothetical protein